MRFMDIDGDLLDNETDELYTGAGGLAEDINLILEQNRLLKLQVEEYRKITLLQQSIIDTDNEIICMLDDETKKKFTVAVDSVETDDELLRSVLWKSREVK